MSGGEPFVKVLAARLTRRTVLAGGAAAAVGFLGTGRSRGARAASPLVGFEPVPLARGGGPNPAISPDYRYSVLIPWGDPLVPGGPEFRYPPESAEQRRKSVIVIRWFRVEGPSLNG